MDDPLCVFLFPVSLKFYNTNVKSTCDRVHLWYYLVNTNKRRQEISSIFRVSSMGRVLENVLKNFRELGTSSRRYSGNGKIHCYSKHNHVVLLPILKTFTRNKSGKSEI